MTTLEDQYISIDALRTSLEDLDQPFICTGKDTIKLRGDLQSGMIVQLPNVSVIRQLIDRSSGVHALTPKYRKLTEAERNWINGQKSN